MSNHQKVVVPSPELGRWHPMLFWFKSSWNLQKKNLKFGEPKSPWQNGLKPHFPCYRHIPAPILLPKTYDSEHPDVCFQSPSSSTVGRVQSWEILYLLFFSHATSSIIHGQWCHGLSDKSLFQNVKPTFWDGEMGNRYCMILHFDFEDYHRPFPSGQRWQFALENPQILSSETNDFDRAMFNIAMWEISRKNMWGRIDQATHSNT